MKKTILPACLIALLLAFAAVKHTRPPAQTNTGPGAKATEHGTVATPLETIAPETALAPDAEPSARGPHQSTALATAPAPQGRAIMHAAGLPAPDQSPAALPPASRTHLDLLATRLRALGSRAEVLAAVDLTDSGQRALAVARLSELETDHVESVRSRAELKGVPLQLTRPDGSIGRLYSFNAEGHPVYRVTTNANAAISTGASQLYAAPYSLTGTGMKVAVWDEGSVRSTHQELTGRITLKDTAAALSDHSTHVAGTIAASGVQAAAKGMASAATIDSYDWNNDYAEMTAAGAATTSATTAIPLSNHSYGFEGTSDDMGRYEVEAQSVDAVAAGLPFYLPCWAAGNEQDLYTSLGGFQSITFIGLAKNVLTVGAVNDAVTSGVRTPSAGTMSYFSSWGPVDDGRIKPDLVSNGVGVYSSVSTGDAAYDTYDGTSMATPSVVGSSALVVQAFKQEFAGQLPRASLLKALLIHTADDLGKAGPDYKFGWGLVNAKAATDLVRSHKASAASPKLLEGTLATGSTTSAQSFTWDGTSPIRATLVWTDPAGTARTAKDSRSPTLVNNLDIQVTGPGGIVYRPFVMPFVGTWTQASMDLPATTGKNQVDTVEQVLIPAPPTPGTYTVLVSADGALTGGSQTFSVAITGGTAVATNPAPSVSLTAPASNATTLAGTPVALEATASDLVLGGGAGSIASVSFFVNGTNVGSDTSAPYGTTWTPTTSGTYEVYAVATDSEGASGSSPVATVYVLSGSGLPSISSFTPGSGPEGSNVTVSGGNFANVTSVSFNGTSAEFAVSSLNSLVATVPTGAATGTISVTTALGTATSATSFTVEKDPVLISQIYGGGGQSGATFANDYVELYNRGTTAVSLSGWTLQYASATGTTWSTVALSGTIQPSGYFLVRLASGGANGSALPTPDATGGTNISATNGKVALSNTTTAFTGATPIGLAGLQDFVGYGTAGAYEGAAAAPSPSTTTAIFRAGNGATDTGNNGADFATGAPSPRNSAGSSAVPVISSPSAAGGTVGTVFSYQIVASNAPTSYTASPLPTGLTVNTSTGLISGTPTAAGTTVVALGAANSAGTGTGSVTITVTSSGGGTVATLSEDFASITAGDSTTTTGSSTSWAGNANFPTVSRAFQAGGAVKLGSSSAVGSITSKTLDLSAGGGAFTVTFKVKGWTTVEGTIQVSLNGANTQTATYTAVMAGAFETKTLQFTGGTASSTITFATSAKRAYLDDIIIGTASAPAPVITLAGTPASLTATYGSASSTPTTFTVSATNLVGPVTVTAPAGFEVSQTAGGASGYAASQAVGTSGTLASTTLYVRLASGVSAGSYSGTITATSSAAQPATLALAASDVLAKALTITAQGRTKTFGSTLTLGTTAFDAAGLVGSETVGAVTLTASGGTGSFDAIGSYTITPSAATGGTFNAGNYSITYQTGTLTVAGLDYATWIGSRFSGLDAADDADPDADGLANVVEFYAGLDPAVAETNPFVLTSNGSELLLSYRRSKAQITHSGSIEWSVTPAATGTWAPDTVTDEFLSDQGAYELRRAHIPLPPAGTSRFVRLRVTLAP